VRTVVSCAYAASRDQLGKGLREESLNERIKSRTLVRRSNSLDSSCSSSLSGKFSIRLSQGSKLSHQAIPAYTSLRPKTPRSGASGKLHSPALKQYPWSMKLAVNFRSPRRFQNAAWRPSALHVHLSMANIPAKVGKFRTRPIIVSGR